MNNGLTLGGLLALVFVLAVGAVVLVVIPACIVSGHISEMERQQEIQSQPNDNKDLSFGHGNEADNAD